MFEDATVLEIRTGKPRTGRCSIEAEHDLPVRGRRGIVRLLAERPDSLPYVALPPEFCSVGRQPRTGRLHCPRDAA